MKVLVLHNELRDDAAADVRDVLVQRDAVSTALTSAGIECRTFGCGLNLDAVQRAVQDDPPDVVFNLVESLGGTDRLMSLVPLLLDSLRIPYTGASSAAILATSGKLAAKQRLRQAGLPTPEWCGADASPARTAPRGVPWIIKPVWEHASRDMGDDCVVSAADPEELRDRLRQAEQRTRLPMFAERFIAGREFNLSVFSGLILPPAEIDFIAFPPGKPRIVGHAAKWDERSFEYQQTPRRFTFGREDAELLETLQDLSRRCWDLFELSGFARVDFRVDEQGQPWILEVNVNPCLSPDAGFAAALAMAEIDFADAVIRLVRQALEPDAEPILQGSSRQSRQPKAAS